MKILAIDPGKTSGWAYHDEDNLYDFGQVKHSDFDDWIADFDKPIDRIIFESYTVLPHMAAKHAGSKLETSQVIGKIKLFGKIRKIKFFESSPGRNATLPRLTGVDPKRHGASHDKTHWAFAYNHGLGHLIDMKLRKTKLQLDMEKKNGN